MIEGKEITSSRGAVVAGPEEAARIGARVIEAGGNAFDGAAAACLACAMLAPQSNGVGGYMLVAVVLGGGAAACGRWMPTPGRRQRLGKTCLNSDPPEQAEG